MNREFIDALEQLEEEKHIEKGVLLEAIESALLAAYRRNYSTTGNINVDNVRVDIDSETGDISVLSRLEVVGEVMDENREISLEDAHDIDARYEIGCDRVCSYTGGLWQNRCSDGKAGRGTENQGSGTLKSIR